MLVGGLAWVIAPERTLRWTYRWNDREWRWFTFGRVRRTPGPKLMADGAAIRVGRWVGLIAIAAGATALAWLATR